MAKEGDEKKAPRRWQEMSVSEQQRVLENLISGGFGSELKARKTFSDHGFDCYAFYFYDTQGPDAGKWREVDIYAHRRDGLTKAAGDFYYHIIAEVKRGYTWIAADIWDPRSLGAGDTTWCREPSWLEEGFERRLFKFNEVDFNAVQGAIGTEDLVAGNASTAIHQYSSSSPAKTKDAWYEAAIKIHKASSSFEYPCMMSGGKRSPDGNVHVIIPLIILEGNLLKVEDGPDGFSLGPQEHIQALLNFRNPDRTERTPLIHVITMDALPAFLERVRIAESKAREATGRLYSKIHSTSE